MAEPCDNAKVLAATLLGNNEEFAKEMIDAASQYQFAKSLMGDKATKNMENEIDLFVRSTIDARILQGEAGLEAYVSLVKRAKNRGGTIASGAELIEMVKNISLKDIDQYAGLLFKEGEGADRAAEVIEDLKNSICQYTARKMNLSMKYETKLKKMQQSTKGKRDKVEKEFKEMEKAQKELKSLVGKMKDGKPITDEEARKMTELVNKLTPIDETWTSMISDAKNGKINVDFYKSYILGRVFLSEDPDVIPDLIKFISLPKGSYSNLTVEMINSLTYNQLVTAVYKNTLQLANNKELRDALKNRIISLMTSSEDGRMSPTAVAYADSLVNTLYFCDAGESFSTVLKYNKVGEAVRKILTDDRGFSLLKGQSNKRIFNALKSLLEDKDLVKNLWSSKKEKTVDFLGVQINGTTLLNMIYAGTWDENLRKAITLHGNIADDIIIDYAKVKMFGGKSKTAEDNLRAVLQKANKEYSANEISTIAYKATSSIPVNPTNPSKIVFIDFREAESTLPDAYNARSRFYDALADINTLTVSSEQVSVYSPDKLDTIGDDIEYIIIPNAKYMSDSRITELKNRIAKKNKEVLVVYPRGKESGNYFVDRGDGLLKYKTSSTTWFNELSDRMAVESLNQAEVPSINNLPQTTAQEKLNELNSAGINFFRHYLGMGDTATNEQVITALSDLTGIPLNWNSMSPADWELANRVAFLNYTVSGNYKTSYLTSEGYDNLVKEYSLYKADDVVEFLKARGYSYDYKTIEANLDSIKEALINMHTSDNVADYIQYKGILIGLANRGEANNITLTEIRRILEGGNENEELAKLLYGNRANGEYTVTELKSTDSFLSDILNAYVDGFSRRVTEAGYTLPMYRPDGAILNYLKGRPITNDYFATSFAVKNGMTLDEPSFKQLFDDMMPSEVSVSSSISPETLRAARKGKGENLTKVIDEIPEEERMLPREYNSYWAALGGRVLSPKASENAKKLAAAVMRERTRASRISREEGMTILKKYFTDEEIEMLNPEFSDEFFKGNPRAEGAFVKGRRSLHFIENPLKGTVEHETVHAYIDMFLTKKERKKLFDYVKKNHLNEVKKFADTHGYTKYVSNGKTYNYTLDQQVEEWIAESFIEYVKKYEGAKKTPKWVSKLGPTMETLYEKIWLAVKNFFNRANVNKLNSFYNDIVEKRRPQGGVIQRGGQSEVKWREGRGIKYPTSDELDEWLGKKSFSDRLKDTFGETNDIKRGIFITKDGSLIKGTSEGGAKDYPIQYPNGKVGIQLEHYGAISPILFNEWDRIGILGSEDYYAQNILRYIQRKEGLIRTRFFENEGRIYITIDTPPEISGAQRRVIQEYVDYLNDELEYSGKTGEISIDGIYGENGRGEGYRLDTDEGRISLNNVDFSTLDNGKAVYNNDEIKNTNERIKSFRGETDDSNYVSINNPYTDKEGGKNHTVWRQADITDNVDNNGNLLSEGQVEYFRDSAVRDSEGNLEEVYHGTRDNIKVPKIGKNKNSAYGPGMYFTTKRESAERFAEGIKGVSSFFKSPKVVSSYLNITNPIETGKYNWNEGWTNALKDLGYNVEGKYLTNKNTDDYNKYMTFWIMNSKKDKDEFVEDIKRVTGYDGVKIDQEGIETYWVAFSPYQVKRTDNLTPTDNPDIRYRLIGEGESAEDITPDNLKNRITEYLSDAYGSNRLREVFGLKEGEDLFNKVVKMSDVRKRFKKLSIEDKINIVDKLGNVSMFLRLDKDFGQATYGWDTSKYDSAVRWISDELFKEIGDKEALEVYENLKGLRGKSIYDVARNSYPLELSIISNLEGEIEGAYLGFSTRNFGLTVQEGTDLSNYVTWHSHPLPQFYSNTDIETSRLRETIKGGNFGWEGLLMPGGLAVKFPNNKETIDKLELIAEKDVNDIIDDLITLTIDSNMKIEDQEWGAFTEYVYKKIAGVDTPDVDDIIEGVKLDLWKYYADELGLVTDGRINWRNAVEGSAGLTETDIIQQILDNYANAVESHIKDGTMTVKLAQDLKQQASYALNVAGEDLILKKYGDLLNASDRNGILGLGFNLNLATNEEELKLLREKNIATMDKFRQRWAEVASKVNKNYNSIDEAGKELMENGKIYTEREGQQVVIDIKDELYNSIKNIPDGAGEFTNLRTLDRNYVNGLTNKQAYTMLKVIALVKQNIAKGNFYTSLMYKLNPQLRRTPNGLNFFENFKAVQIADDGNGNKLYVPKILVPNNTLGFVEPGKQLDNTIDLDIKSSILKDIYNDFISKGKVMKQEDLEKIVDDAVKGSVGEPYKQYYLNAYAPYVNLMGIHNDTYNYLTKILSEETEEIRNLLKDIATGDGSDWDLQWQNLLNMKVTLDDGSTVTVGDMVSGNAKRWEQRLFGEMGNKEAFGELDEAGAKEQLKGAYSWYNDVNNITNNEAKIITGLLGNARKLLQRDTNTNQFVEFDYTVGGQNDTVKSLLLWNVFSGMIPGADASKVKKRVNSARRGGRLLLGWNNVGAFNSGNWKKIQQLYEIYYAKDLQELKKTQAPDDALHQTALEMAKYFKTIENTLGSKDGIKGVALNDLSVNKAFGNIGTIVRDIDGAGNVFSLMNKIGNNQVLGFFKFTKKGSPAYNETLKRWGTGTKKARYLFSPVAQNYIEYSNANKEDMKEEFNSIFGTTFTTDEANMAIQALGGYKMIGNSKAEEWINNINGFISNTMTLTRMLMTYPLQLLTIYPQLFAYNVKANGIKEALGVENVADARRIRQKYGILEGTYVDIPFGNWFDSIFSRDSDEIENLGLNIDDGVMGLYGKTTDYVVSNYTTPQLLALGDSVRDNANNIVDAAMAQTFKSLAFVKALQNNDFITFMNPHLFEEFMNNPEVSKEIKDKLLDRVNNYSNRLLQDMLGIGFTGLDRVYTSGAVGDVLSGLLSAINFKGAWGTNMFRQTFEKAFTIYKIAKRDGWSIDRTVKDIMAIPEMTTLLSCMFADAVWMWRLGKFNDNGKVPDSDAEFTTAYALDFISWIADNIDLVSQQWQGLISFGGTRPFLKGAQVGFRGAQGEGKTAAERIGDFAVYGLGGFIQSFATNLGRNWKPAAFVTEALLVLEQQGYDAFINYLQNSWYMISGGTIRYMIEEGENAYGSNIPLNIETKGIPSLLAGNQYEDSDTAFSFKVRELESGEYLKSLYKSDRDGWYGLSQGVTLLVNSSQFLKTLRNIWYMVGTPLDASLNDGFLTWSKRNFGIYDMTTIEDDLKASPTFVELQETGKARPNTAEQAKDLVETFTQPTYLGGYKAYQGIQNFIKSGHLNGKEEGYYYDRDLEEFYQRIEETKPGTLEETMKLFNSYFLGDPDGEEARKFLYSWAWQWLDTFKNDPEYNKYKATFARGTLNNLYYGKLANLALVETAKRKAMGFPDNLAKVSVTDLKNNNIAIEGFNTKFADTYYDTMYDADRALVQNKIYNWVAEELDDGTVKKYFSKQKKKDWEGNETDKEEYVLDSNLKAQLRQEVEFEGFLADGDWENAIASAAILTRQLAYGDESGLIQAALTKRYVDRIQDSDLPEELKIAAIAKLMDNNEEAFKYNSDFAEKYPEIWAQGKSYLNDILHGINGSVITDLNNMAIMTDALNEALEDALSSSGKKSKGSSLLGGGGGVGTGLKLTSKLAKLSSDINKSPGTAKAIEPATMKIIPIPIKGIFPESKYNKPTFTVRTYTTKGYDPKTKTLGPITPPKKNKAVKSKSTRKMTQKEENELDLI